MVIAGAKFEMPGSIDKAPRHDEATGWSSTAISYQRGEADPPHHHVEGQLLFATSGVMLVQTESDHWVIPPQRALWLPPLHIHSLVFHARRHLPLLFAAFWGQRHAILCLKPGNHVRFSLISDNHTTLLEICLLVEKQVVG